MTSPNSPTEPQSSGGEAGDAALEAARALVDLSLGHLYTAALDTVVTHRIADHLADGPLTPDELADRAGVRAQPLRRVLRLLAGRGVFREEDDGTFRLTAAAELLRDVPGSLRDGIVLTAGGLMNRAVADLPDTVRTGVPGFDTVYGAPFFAHLARHPDAQQMFDRAMTSLSGPINDIVVAHYPFPDSGTVVDVGGGRGGLLRAALERNPGLSGVLFDQEQTVPDHLLDTKELTGRWRVESGDFFEAVPSGGDVYLLKNILHDWSDEECVRILRAIRAAVPPSGRLVAVDVVLPPGNDPHPGKAIDLVMLALVTGRERTREEFASLFQEAGFALTQVIATPALPSVIEATPLP
ncbi:ArsR family transcriptional regulator [Streptomyces sp. NPDC059063]|uniref:ArsR family transcriptional regulator n=1 Tax=unclassified Streptomyces TaxID=2593676 RepID=UPI003682833C